MQRLNASGLLRKKRKSIYLLPYKISKIWDFQSLSMEPFIRGNL